MRHIPSNRMLSLDVFRGITIAGMILVNNPGDWSFVYSPLLHAPWHGWTPTDFIFPFFLFIVGVSMSFSLSKVLQRGDKPLTLYPKIFRRTAILFGLGVFLHLIPIDFPAGYNWFTDTFANVRFTGVLQRIALVYCFASLIVIHFQRRKQIYWAGGLLIAYWAMMKLIPFTIIENGVPVVYRGDLGPEINFAAYIDDLFLHGHTYRIGKYFHHDPEGILSTIPAISTALIGVFTGDWLKAGKAPYEMTAGLFFSGVTGLLLGAILDLGFPINKPLWSPSYVVFMGGMALIFLAMCVYLIDIKGYKQWIQPFVIFGMNPIALYILAETGTRILLLVRVGGAKRLQSWLYDTFYTSWLSDINASFAFALVYVFFWFGIMTIFYKKNIFIKI